MAIDSGYWGTSGCTHMDADDVAALLIKLYADYQHYYGSENNDDFCIVDGEIKTATNNAGGINGGITNGMPVVFRTAIKPTPSIYKEQNSVSLADKTEKKLQIQGRHDPCIVQRAVPVVEAVTAFTILDLIL